MTLEPANNLKPSSRSAFFAALQNLSNSRSIRCNGLLHKDMLPLLHGILESAQVGTQEYSLTITTSAASIARAVAVKPIKNTLRRIRPRDHRYCLAESGNLPLFPPESRKASATATSLVPGTFRVFGSLHHGLFLHIQLVAILITSLPPACAKPCDREHCRRGSSARLKNGPSDLNF